MICSACGAANRDGRKFCSQCGSGLGLVCPACGASNEPGERFCGECGTQLGAPASAVVAGGAGPQSKSIEPGAELRLVSVLFADLVGFTSMSSDRDPEDVRELLTAYFDACRRIIQRYGGVVEKFIGDAVMALWGSPVAREDDAERAVRAALDLVSAVEGLGAENDLPDLRLRAAVMTGHAAVTLGAESQGMVAGDLVNTASRLQGVAAPGTVLVDDATRRTTDAAIAYEDGGAHDLKGKIEPVAAWRALRVTAGRGGAQRSEGLEAPFVGRDRELRLIKEMFHACAEEKRTHLVSVVGMAGIGKSRLAWEFEKYIDGVAEKVYWHMGRCLAYGEAVTDWALEGMVRMRAGIVEGEDRSSAVAKLHETLETIIQDPGERDWVEPRLRHLLALEERRSDMPEFRREDLFSAWRVFFERMAEKQPTVLVFEDLQWSDSGLLDFIEYLMEWSRDRPLFVLTLARPDLMESRPDWGVARRNSTSLFLDPLTGGAMRALLDGLAPGLPGDLVTRIEERAQGVPLYSVETIRMLIDRGSIRKVGDGCEAVGEISSLDVPETLHALVAARLDGLPPDERRLLQDASVLGKTFTSERLAAIAGMNVGQVEPALGDLVRKEMLTLQVDPRSPEHGQYGFTQTLVRTVAYGTMSKRERKVRHLAAAADLERNRGTEPEEVVEVIASHYVDAYELAPDAPDADEIKAHAVSALIGAGQRARSLGSAEQAERYFERAAELTDDPQSLGELLERAGEAARAAGKGKDARSLYERAHELYSGSGNSRAAARVAANLGEVLWHYFSQLETAAEHLQRAFDVLEKDDRDADFAATAAGLARLLVFMGRIDEAAGIVEQALDAAERLWLPEVLAEALTTKSAILGSKARREEELALLERAVAIASEHEIGRSAMRAHNNLGESLNSKERFDDARRNFENGLELARRYGDQGWEWYMLQQLGIDLFRRGEWDEAERVAARLPDPEDENSPNRVREYYGYPLSLLYAHRGDIEQAKRCLALVDYWRDSADVQDRGSIALLDAEFAFAQGDFEQAFEAAMKVTPEAIGPWGIEFSSWAFGVAGDSAIMLEDWDKVRTVEVAMRSIPTRDLHRWRGAQLDRYEGHLAAVAGLGSDARRHFERATETFRELQYGFELALTCLEYGRWLSSISPVEADAVLDEAQSLFERMGVPNWLRRVEIARGPAQLQVG